MQFLSTVIDIIEIANFGWKNVDVTRTLGMCVGKAHPEQD